MTSIELIPYARSQNETPVERSRLFQVHEGKSGPAAKVAEPLKMEGGYTVLLSVRYRICDVGAERFEPGPACCETGHAPLTRIHCTQQKK